MKKIYFAAPLFNEMELKRNEEYTQLLEEWDIKFIFHKEKQDFLHKF